MIMPMKPTENKEQEVIEQVKNILDNEKLPDIPVKVVKKETGLFERTDNSTILLTEDNKILLTD